MNLIGRKEEISRLDSAMQSGMPEFIAVYGRRRVGKTYLIREYFNNKFSFYASGSTEAKTNRQKLKIFHDSLKRYGSSEKSVPQDWMEAFNRLRNLLMKDDVCLDPATGRKVIFLDELPWFDTGKSDFRMALDVFWNTWASAQQDVCLIICGSATSWILNKMVLDRGGFHNRLTRQIHLRPFTLAECEELLHSKGLDLPRNEVIRAYMVFGGIPFYLNMIDRRLSLDQNIQALLFNEYGELHNEYKILFNALFNNPQKHAKIIDSLTESKRGLSRTELSAGTGINNGGSLTEMLFELEQCGFIREFSGYNKNIYGKMYQITDPFSVFYTTFLKDRKMENWMQFVGTPAYYAWEGLAFETVCLNHTEQIKTILGISGISADIYSWQGKATGKRKGAQIDLLIDRADSVINLCEMKYTQEPFTIDEEYKNKLINKRELFKEATKTRKAVNIIMISAGGVKKNGYYNIIQRDINGDELFV